MIRAIRTLCAAGLTVLVAMPLAAQHVPSAPKDAGVATILGFVFPGGGQYYSENTNKGLLVSIGTALAVAGGYALSNGDEYTSDLVTVPVSPSNPLGLEFRERLSKTANRMPLMAGAAVGGAFWLYGALTASADARAANEKRVSLITTPSRFGLSVGF